MANILIGYNNRALEATMASVGSWYGTLVPDNIKSERLALVARTSSASRYDTSFVAKFAANYAIRAIALLNHNVSTAGRWRARLSAATLDLDYTGANPRDPGTVTCSGGTNGTRVNYLGEIVSGICPRIDYSPVNLASGAATQTVSSVPAGRYVLSCSGSGSVTATGSTVDNSGTVGTQSIVTFVDVTATGDVTLTVAGTVTAIHFRESLGLLKEDARTNLLTYGAQLDNAAWTKSALTVTANATTGPDGTASSDKLIPDATTGVHYVIQSATTSIGVVYTISLKVKAAEYSCVGLEVTAVGNFSFDTATGTIQTSGAVTVDKKMDAAGHWRMWLTFTATSTSHSYVIYPQSSIGVFSFLGDATSGIYVTGVQLEAGPLPTSYIPTTSAAVTRTADSVSLTSTAFTATHSATAGTLYAEFTLTATSGTQPILSLDDNTANERMELYSSGTDLKFKVVDGGSTVVDLTIGTIAAAMRYKVAAAWSANDFAACLGGGTVATDTSGTLPTVDRMRAGSNQAGDFMCGHLSRFGRWNARLTNAELQAITTTGPEAIGYDSGWQDALAMTFHGDTPTNWGAQYPLIAATSEAVTARYLTVEIDDTTNAAGYVQIGHLYASGGFQPEHNAEYPGFADGRIDPSDVETSVTGRVYGTKREQRRKVDFSLPVLSPDEADHVDELRAAMGITESVLYVPDPADAAHSQRYSFWGRFAEVNQLEYPFYNNRSTIFRLEQKK